MAAALQHGDNSNVATHPDHSSLCEGSDVETSMEQAMQRGRERQEGESV